MTASEIRHGRDFGSSSTHARTLRRRPNFLSSASRSVGALWRISTGPQLQGACKSRSLSWQHHSGQKRSAHGVGRARANRCERGAAAKLAQPAVRKWIPLGYAADRGSLLSTCGDALAWDYLVGSPPGAPQEPSIRLSSFAPVSTRPFRSRPQNPSHDSCLTLLHFVHNYPPRLSSDDR